MRIEFNPLAPAAPRTPWVDSQFSAQAWALARAAALQRRVRAARESLSLAPGHVDMAVALCAAVCELGLAMGVAQMSLPVVFAVVAHLTVVAAMVRAGGARSAAQNAAHPWRQWLALCTLWLGPWGVLGVGLSALLRSRQAGRCSGVADAYADWLAAEPLQPGAALCERIQRGHRGVPRPDTLTPFRDVMDGGSVEHRQAVVALIAAHFTPTFAGTLRDALNDAEPGVRVQAATAMARIETRFLESSIALAQRCALEPQRSECSLALARHCDEHANTGLLDAVRARAERLQALARYHECELHGAASEQISNAVIRLLVRLGRVEEAVDAFAPQVEGGQAAPELFAWYAECLFELGRYTDLRRACAQFAPAPGGPDGLSESCREALALWAGVCPRTPDA